MKKILSSSAILLSTLVLFACSNENTKKISEKKATDIALKDANLTEKKVSKLKVKTDKEDGVDTYEIDFQTKEKEYDYTVNAKDGKIIYKSTEKTGLGIVDKAKDATKESISQDKAKEIVLKDANISESDTKFFNIKKEVDNAMSVYEIEFTTSNKEYDYTVNAKTGEIIEKSTDNQ